MMSPHPDLQSRAEFFQKSIEQFIAEGRHDKASGASSAVSITNCGPMSGGSSADRHIHRRCFAVLPSRVDPRWLLPLGDSRSTLEALQVYRPYRRRARILMALMRCLIPTGWTGWGCDRLLITSEQSLPLESLVSTITGEQNPIFALSLGTLGRFCKLAIQVMRASGEILGYVKLPLTEAARERVWRESRMLEKLWEIESLRPKIPKVLYAGEWDSGYILFQSPVQGRRGPAKFSEIHADFLRTLRAVHQVEKPGSAMVEQVAVRWEAAAGRLDTEWRQLGTEALAWAVRELGSMKVPCGIMHGDFAPWNTRESDGRLQVFDWEAAEWEAPIWWDVLHFHTQVACLLGNKWRREPALVAAEAPRSTLLLYILKSVCESLEEGAEGRTGIEFRRRLLRDELARKVKSKPQPALSATRPMARLR